MAVSAFLFSAVMVGVFTQPAGQPVDWDSDDIKAMLTTNAYVPDQEAHTVKDDVTDEISGTGYTAGGETLAGKTISAVANVVSVGADPIEWPGATFTARRAVFYDDAGATDADKRLIGWIDFGTDLSIIAGTFSLALPGDVLFTITVPAAP